MSGYALSPHDEHQKDHTVHDHQDIQPRPNTNGKGSPMAIEITARQKMLAACSGSLLTSLLVTPLDVVRVRLQAQDNTQKTSRSIHPSSPLSLLQPHKFASQHISLPSAVHISRPLQDLGVTACCREVFWVSSTSPLCMATPAIPISPESSTVHGTIDTCMVEQSSRRNFSGTWEGLVKIARYEGITSLYRGLSPTLLMSIPANVIYFTGYDALRYSKASPLSKLHDNVAPFIAGSLARTIAATVISPLELFRTRLQAMSMPNKGASSGSSSISAFRETMNGVRSMVAVDGVTSLWRGLILTLWRDVPFSGIYWWGYETGRAFLAQERYGREHKLSHLESHKSDIVPKDISDSATFSDSFSAGAVSGAIAAFVTTPFDVGKTRRQVWTSHSDHTALKEQTMPKVLYGIYQREGLRGLFTGCIPRILKVAPACAIMISSYEVGKKMALRINTKSEEKRRSYQ